MSNILIWFSLIIFKVYDTFLQPEMLALSIWYSSHGKWKYVQHVQATEWAPSSHTSHLPLISVASWMWQTIMKYICLHKCIRSPTTASLRAGGSHLNLKLICKCTHHTILSSRLIFWYTLNITSPKHGKIIFLR